MCVASVGLMELDNQNGRLHASFRGFQASICDPLYTRRVQEDVLEVVDHLGDRLHISILFCTTWDVCLSCASVPYSLMICAGFRPCPQRISQESHRRAFCGAGWLVRNDTPSDESSYQMLRVFTCGKGRSGHRDEHYRSSTGRSRRKHLPQMFPF